MLYAMFFLGLIPVLAIADAFLGADDFDIDDSDDSDADPVTLEGAANGLETLMEAAGSDYMAGSEDIPLTLAQFTPGADSLLLEIDEAPPPLFEVAFDGGGCGIVD